MKHKKLYFLFALTFVISCGYSIIPDSLIKTLTFKLDDNKSIHIKNGKKQVSNLFLIPEWLYFNYDNATLKDINLNDTGYVLYNSKLGAGLNFSFGQDNSILKDFENSAWFKCYFRLPKDQINKVYGLYTSLHGAAQIYVDGKLEKTIGKIDVNGKSIKEANVSGIPISFYIGDTSVHCIAVKFVFTNYHKLIKQFPKGIELPAFEFTDPEISNQNNDALSIYYSLTNMLSAFFFALFVIHLLIYLFNREKNFNLLYALFLFLISLSFLEAYVLKYVENLHNYLWLSNADNIVFPTVCFLLVTLLNKLLNEKSSWHYKGLSFLLIFLVIDVFFIHRYSRTISITIVFYTYFNTLAHSIKGVRRKIPSARFLGWGILGLTLSAVLLILSTIVTSMFSMKSHEENWALFIYTFFIILSILSIPLSMSAYLAYDFARTNKYLADKLKENEILNKKSLEQEKEKQEILSNQNRTLESQVQQRTKEIGEQNKLLEHQKKEITDSITYAKRIQQALLPELNEIKSKLPDSFILYLPKDIVSGDFYFFQSIEGTKEHPGRASLKNEKGIYIAAADCTGHGVPGALMSMIVHEKLEAATKIYSEPKDILKSINKQVKDALKQYQNENSSRDGCDIAFLKIVGNTLSYSGAYRPLYYFDTNGGFNELKATKTAIAGLTPYDQEFNQHELDTNNLKAIYIFSDGFADQFGGEKTKKLTTKKFKELLSKLVDLPVEEQKIRLEDFFAGWKGNVEQIDDVLIIGILFK